MVPEAAVQWGLQNVTMNKQIGACVQELGPKMRINLDFSVWHSLWPAGILPSISTKVQ